MKKQIVALLCALAFISHTYSQNWIATGNFGIGAANNIFGANADNANLRWRTAGIDRMWLNANLNMNAAYLSPPSFIFSNANYPGYAPYNANGFVGINTDQPRTRLEIHGKQNLTPSFGTGWRPWMQTGITMTGNNDLSYFLA